MVDYSSSQNKAPVIEGGDLSISEKVFICQTERVVFYSKRAFLNDHTSRTEPAVAKKNLSFIAV